MAGEALCRLLQNRELSTGSEVLTVLRVQGREPEIAGLDRLGEYHALQVGTLGKLTLHNGFAPMLTVVADLYLIRLYPSVLGILTRQISEALQGLHCTTVEIHPVRIVGHSHAVSRMPSSA